LEIRSFKEARMGIASEVMKLAPKVRRIAMALSRKNSAFSADDLAQEAFVALISAFKRFDPSRQVNFQSYSATRLRGAMFDAMRQSGCRESEELVDDLIPDMPFKEMRSAESREMIIRFSRFLHIAMSKLGKIEKDVVRLRYMQGLSVRDVAKLLGVSIATVSRTERRALENLRSMFETTNFGRNLDVLGVRP